MKKSLNNILHPTKVFFAIVFVSVFWILPIFNSDSKAQPNQSLAVYAGEYTGLSCSYGCQIDVCTKWVPPSATCQPDNPWDIGCCVRWERQCGPDCEEEPLPNQPPTITHSLTCSSNGNNGWCKGNLILDLTASDPQNAQVIISGIINGNNFACPTGNTTCSIPLTDGQGAITYRVDSSTGLSDSDTTTYQLDSTTPQISGNISGTNGLNNWFTTSVIVSAIVTDNNSGIASFEMNINNTGWVTYAETTFTDGIHSIQYRAIDNAGNITETAIQEIKVDTVTPVINISITGTSGLNSWYTSTVTATATADDITSGVSTFEVSIDSGATWSMVNSPLSFTDGIHTIQYRAIDNAGNAYITTQQEIKVDSTTPSLSLSTTGTKGQNDWYTSIVSITPTATDNTSGVASIEYQLNNGTFTAYTSPLQFTDGINSYQIKVTDNAGNTTSTPSLTLKVDTIAPIVNMDDEIDLGDTLYYSLEDNGSGLWINRTVIEDEDEKYKKIVWLDEISGNKIKGDILWDGKFKDGTNAPVGEYYITLKISDQAGNETFHTTEVQVNTLSYLLPITPFTPPTTNTDLLINQLPSDEGEQSFGNENNGNTGNETSNSSSGGETVFANAIAQAGTMTTSSSLFNFGNENTATPITNTNILWGAVAAAAVGMTLAEWQKKREEEERQAKGPNTAGRKKYEEKMRMKRIIGESQALLDEKKEQKNNLSHRTRITDPDKVDLTENERLQIYKQTDAYKKREQVYKEYQAEKEQEKQNAVYAARWAGIASVAQAKEKENPETIFEKGYNWVADNLYGIFKQKEKVDSLKPLQFIQRTDNRYSVGVDNDLAQTKSTQYLDNIAKEGFEYAAGGGYKPITLLKKAGKGLLKSIVPSGADLASPFFFNTLEYTMGDKKTEDDKTQKIILDSLVDIGGTIVTGLIAAVAVFGIAAIVVAAAPVLGLTVAVSLPVFLGTTFVVGTALDFGLELAGWKEPIKDSVNSWWDTSVEPVIELAMTNQLQAQPNLLYQHLIRKYQPQHLHQPLTKLRTIYQTPL